MRLFSVSFSFFSATYGLVSSNSVDVFEVALQDLLAQREKLENAERNLDEIERTTRMTQRNLNSLKSFFGGFFKNKFSRSSKEPTPAQVYFTLLSVKRNIFCQNNGLLVMC